MSKLLAMYVAAQLAHAAAGNASTGGQLPISPAIDDPNVRAKNLMVWEDFRIFYHAIVKALGDDTPNTGWPAPKLDLAGLLHADLVGSLVRKFLNGNPALPSPAPRLPDPGK